MKLYLELDNMTGLSNEIEKVVIHYVPQYDLIKPHKMILISLQQKGSFISGLSPSAGMRSVVLLRKSCTYSLRSGRSRRAY